MEENMNWYSSVDSIEYNLEHICHSLASNDLKLDNLKQICELVFMEYIVDHTTPDNKYKPSNKVPNAPKVKNRARRTLFETNT
jgi:hypothetical protein